MYKACIFDLDGTLADTIESIAYFANKALEFYGFNEIPADKYKLMVGDGAKELVKRMLYESGDNELKYYDRVSEMYNKTYDDDFMYKTEAYDGIKELLIDLKKLGTKLAVLSNKPHNTAVKVVSALFGEELFEVCFGKRDNVPKKPDPAAVFDIMRKLKVNKNECLYIGDTSTDINTGKNAGLYTIGVLWGFRGFDELKKASADLIVNKPNEIYEFIIKNN